MLGGSLMGALGQSPSLTGSCRLPSAWPGLSAESSSNAQPCMTLQGLQTGQALTQHTAACPQVLATGMLAGTSALERRAAHAAAVAWVPTPLGATAMQIVHQKVTWCAALRPEAAALYWGALSAEVEVPVCCYLTCCDSWGSKNTSWSVRCPTK